MSYPFYLKIKNRVCISYGGHNSEYLVQLRLLREILEKEFPELEITFACLNDYIHYLDGERVIDMAELHDRKVEFAFNYEIIYDANYKKHPVLKLLQESNIQPKKIPVGSPKGYIAYVAALGDFPNKSLTSDQIKKAVNFANNKGFKTEVIENKMSAYEVRRLVIGAAYVIGTANEFFYEAVAAETPTILIPTDTKAEEMYKLLVESPKVLP